MPARTTAPPVRIVNGKKTFIPLENNPESLSLLSSLLEIHKVSFHDIFSLDPIIQDIPRPVHALIFISPSPVYYKLHESVAHEFGPSAGSSAPYPISGPHQPIAWFKQTIGHACGLMALLHAVANGRGTSHVTPDSPLARILEQAQPLDVEARAKLLYDSEDLEKAHMTAAADGDTNPPDPSEPNGMHFICFVKGDDGRLWDLEGGWSGPKELGKLDADEDVLCEKAIRLGPGRYLQIGREMGISEFSCVALVEEI